MSSNTLEKALLKYVNKEAFCDVTLVSDDLQQFPAHKLVLAAHSPVLESLLLSLKQNNENTVLHMRGYTGTSIQIMLNFMYSGKNLAECDSNFANLATDLKIPGLKKVVTKSNNIALVNKQENLNEISQNHLILNQASISLNLINENTEEKEIDSDKSKVGEGRELMLVEEDYDVVDEDISRKEPKVSRGSLNFFKLIDNVPNMLECVFCEEVEERKAELNLHVRKYHSEVKEYKCKVCKKEYKSVFHLEYHFHAHHRPHPYQCSKCDYTSGLKGKVGTHYSDQHLPKHPKKRFICKKCSYTTHSHYLIKAHVKNIHGEGAEKLKCEQCGALLAGKASLFSHIELKHKREKRFTCSRCPYRAPNKVYLKIHEEGIHEGVLRECSQCDYKSKSPFGLKNHINISHKGIRYNCNQCSQVYKNKTQLKRHEFKKHNVPHTFRERILDT